MSNAKGQRVILSLDGGGIRGAATAQFLKRLDESLGGALVNKVDFFAGTSTGSIIALALACCKKSPADLVTLYNHENGTQIMPMSIWDRTLGLLQPEPKYDGLGKTQLLQQNLGGFTLGDTPPGKVAMAVAYDVENRCSLVFKSPAPAHRPLQVYQVADCSSAAPGYFPTRPIGIGGVTRWLMDGAVIANNPTLCAISEALKLWGGQTGDFVVLSVGTGYRTRKINGPDSVKFGMPEWITHDLIGIITDETVVDYQAKTLMPAGNYLRVNGKMDRASLRHPPNDEMDDTSEVNIEDLQEMGDAWFEQFGAAAAALIG